MKDGTDLAMKPNDFESKLAWSREAELSVADWLKTNGYFIIPSYDYSGSNGDKAPKMQSIKHCYPVPDLDVSKNGGRTWIEVKRYGYAPYNRKHGCYVHGISKRLYDSYYKVEKITGCEVWLAIEEEKRNLLLIARLFKLKALLCQCGCVEGKPCKAKIKNGIYFNVAEFIHYKSTLNVEHIT